MIDKEKLKDVTTSLVEIIREYLADPITSSRLVTLHDAVPTTFKDIPDDGRLSPDLVLKLYASPHSVDLKEVNENLAHLYTSEAKRFYSLFAYLYFFTINASSDERYEEAFSPLAGNNLISACSFIAAYCSLVLMYYYDDGLSFNDETLYLFVNSWKKEALVLKDIEDDKERFNCLMRIISSVIWSVLIRLETDSVVH